MSVTLGHLPDKVAVWPRYAKALIAFAAGAVMVPAMPPWCIWPCMFIGLSVFYILLSSAQSARGAFGYGWLFGFGYFAPGLSWIANALLVDGNDFAWAYPFAVAGLPALLSFFPALACAGTKRFGNLRAFSGWLLFVSLLMTSEWLRGNIFTGFPWNLYGYTWAHTLPMVQMVSLGGTYWLSLATCMWATLPGFLAIWPYKRWVKAVFILALLADMGGCYLYGKARLESHPSSMSHKFAIRLVQPDIQQADKWNPAKVAENLAKILSLSEARAVNDMATTLIIWPETAISDYTLSDPIARAAIKSVLAGYNDVYLLTGIMRFEKQEDGHKKYFNSLEVFNKQLDSVAIYNKSHLVPFGEYIPLQKFIPLTPLVKFSGFEPGNGPETFILPHDLASFSPLVCYEIIFPGAVTANGKRPDFIVNVTNDAWYGDSSGPRQHFVQAQFRAVEEGIPVVRSANTGISGIIDPLGRITRRENLMTQAGNNAALPRKFQNATLFTKLKNRLFLITIAGLLMISIIMQAHKIISEKRV